MDDCGIRREVVIAKGFAKAEKLECEMGSVPKVESDLRKIVGTEAIRVERTEVAPARLGTVVVQDRNGGGYSTLSGGGLIGGRWWHRVTEARREFFSLGCERKTLEELSRH